LPGVFGDESYWHVIVTFRRVKPLPTYCYVKGFFLEKIDPKYDSVNFTGATLKNVTQQIPSLKILEARSSSERMQTVVKYQKSGPGNNGMGEVKGKKGF
jgi:hypothetical protein